MGAGCNYRLPEDPELLAYWVDFDDTHETGFECTAELIEEVILEMKQAEWANGTIYYGKSFEVTFAETYQGGGILIHLGMHTVRDYHSEYKSCLANLAKAYNKIIREVNQHFPVHCAAGCWTSCRYDIGEFKDA